MSDKQDSGKEKLKDAVFTYIKKKYKVLPEYPWKRYPDNAVFRHSDNNKWFALVMEVGGDKLGLNNADYIPVINVNWSASVMFSNIRKGILSFTCINTLPPRWKGWAETAYWLSLRGPRSLHVIRPDSFGKPGWNN